MPTIVSVPRGVGIVLALVPLILSSAAVALAQGSGTALLYTAGPNVRITCDGTSYSILKKKITLDAGEHDLALRWDAHGWSAKNLIELGLVATAGSVYRLRAEVDPATLRWYAWVEDAATGEVVSGESPVRSTNLASAAATELLSVIRRHEIFGLDIAPDIPEEKRQNARLFNLIPLGETVLALVDCTTWGSAKYGLVVGLRGIYFNNSPSSFWQGEEFLPYEELPGGEIKKSSMIAISVGGKKLDAGGASMPKKRIVTMLQDIQSQISEKGPREVVVAEAKPSPPLPTLTDSEVIVHPSAEDEPMVEEEARKIIREVLIGISRNEKETKVDERGFYWPHYGSSVTGARASIIPAPNLISLLGDVFTQQADTFVVGLPFKVLFDWVGMITVKPEPQLGKKPGPQRFSLSIYQEGSFFTEYYYRQLVRKKALFRSNPVVLTGLSETKKDNLKRALLTLCPKLSDQPMIRRENTFLFPGTSEDPPMTNLLVTLSSDCEACFDVVVWVNGEEVGTLQAGESLSTEVAMGSFHGIRATGTKVRGGKRKVRWPQKALFADRPEYSYAITP